MDALEMALLFDYYGGMLTKKQKECFDMRYNQDLSLGEIGQELGISRQGVHDNLTRTEALLVNMEEKTGCARRDQRCRKVINEILKSALELRNSTDVKISAAAQRIISAAETLEE